jgi:Zn-dependent protease
MWKRLLLGVIAGGLFGVMIIIRQLALNFLALKRNIPLRIVTIYVLGGVPGIGKENTTPLLEILFGTAGLLFSMMAAGIFYVVYAILVVNGDVIMASLVAWLSLIFILIVFFHFIPGFPLDGGRILRAIIWKASGDYDRATLITVWIGRGVGLLFIAGGLTLIFLNRQWSVGSVLSIVGWILYGTATQESRMTSLRLILRNIPVSEVMIRDYQVVSPRLSLDQIIHDNINNTLVTGQGYFIVVDNAKLVGCMETRNIKAIPKKLWKSKLVGDAMTPAILIETARTDQSAADLFEQMTEMGVDHVPVMDGEQVAGRCDRQTLVLLGKIKGELAI